LHDKGVKIPISKTINKITLKKINAFPKVYAGMIPTVNGYINT